MSDQHVPVIVAHKGASAYRIGNTTEAFELAIEQGADCIELDVQSTADGEIVVHDTWFVGDGSRRQAIASLSFADVQRIRSDSPGEPSILTLSAAIEAVRATHVEILVELKNSMLLQSSDLGRRVAAQLSQEEFIDRSAVFSFDHTLIAAMGPGFGVRRGLLYVGRLVNLEQAVLTTGAEFIETRNDFLDRRMVDQLHDDGLRVCGWATDDPDELRRLGDLGVDMVTTNAPDVARAALTR